MWGHIGPLLEELRQTMDRHGNGAMSSIAKASNMKHRDQRGSVNLRRLYVEVRFAFGRACSSRSYLQSWSAQAEGCLRSGCRRIRCHSCIKSVSVLPQARSKRGCDTRACSFTRQCLQSQRGYDYQHGERPFGGQGGGAPAHRGCGCEHVDP